MRFFLFLNNVNNTTFDDSTKIIYEFKYKRKDYRNDNNEDMVEKGSIPFLFPNKQYI